MEFYFVTGYYSGSMDRDGRTISYRKLCVLSVSDTVNGVKAESLGCATDDVFNGLSLGWNKVYFNRYGRVTACEPVEFSDVPVACVDGINTLLEVAT